MQKDTETLKTSMERPTAERLTLFQEDSLASLSVLPGSEKARKTTAISGLRCLESFRKCSRVTSWEKMLVASLVGTTDWFSSKCFLTWKMKASRSGRTYFQLVPSTPRTEETGFGLLPTPVASDATTGCIVGKNDTFKKNKTGTLRKVNQNGIDGSIGLGRMITMGLLPTPNASDNRNRGKLSDPSIQRRIKLGKQVGLSVFLMETGGAFPNPEFLEAMMGYPIGWTELKPSETQSSHK